MARLNPQAAPGFNAGKILYANSLRVTDIEIDPEISDIFKVSDEIRDKIKQKMEQTGFDKSQPLPVWKLDGRYILVDGHTRLAAAKDAGLEEIPAVVMEFENREDAVVYTLERQALRRNLTGREIMKAAGMLPETRMKRGGGRAAEHMAERIGTSFTTIYQAHAINKKASNEVKQKVLDGEMSIKAGYKTTIEPKGKTITVTSQDSDPSEAAVIIINSVISAESKIDIARTIIKSRPDDCLEMLNEAMEYLNTAQKQFSCAGTAKCPEAAR